MQFYQPANILSQNCICLFEDTYTSHFTLKYTGVNKTIENYVVQAQEFVQAQEGFQLHLVNYPKCITRSFRFVDVVSMTTHIWYI